MKLRQNRGKMASIDLFFADGFDLVPIARQVWLAIEPFANYIMYDGRKADTNVDGAVPGGIMPDNVFRLLASAAESGSLVKE